jgi:hypothetical protein
LPVALLFARRRGPIDLLCLPPRPRPRRLPARLAAITLPRPSWPKALLTSFEQTPPGTRPARQPFTSAARLIFGMACSTLGRAHGRSLLPEALPRRGRPSPSGRSRSSDQYEINNSIAKIGCPRTRLSGVLFSPPAAVRLPPAAQCFPHQFSPAGIRSPLLSIGGMVPAGPPKWLPPPPPPTASANLLQTRRPRTIDSRRRTEVRLSAT